ncbi:MAG: aldo/keto reductase [Prevotellaceae bacterium]|nr:aldo/keto reductase [Candidatus Faecinaster equi]
MEGINKLVLGTVQFGCQYGINSAGRPSKEMVSEILAEAKRAGITKLDTSSAYGDSEQVLGECIPAEAEFDIVSKFPKGIGPINDAIEGSLGRLRTKRLYGYLLHHFELYKENPSLWDDFVKLKEDGKVGKIGFSLYTPEELELLLQNKVQFDLLQIPHNIFDRKFDPYLKELADAGVEIHVRSTFLQGLFFKERNTLSEKMHPLKKYLLELDEYSKDRGLSISELALNYNIQNSYIQGVLIGVDNVEQLRMNVSSISEKKINLDINVKEQELLNPVNWK